MQTWLLANWSILTGALSTLLALLGTWRFGPRAKGWLANRWNAETDLIECRRRSEHREALLADLIAEVELYRQLRAGSESKSASTTPPPTKSLKP